MDLETLKIMDDKLEKCKGTCTFSEDKLDKRVSDKVDKATFFWIIGIAYTIVAAILGVLYGRISTLEQANTKIYFDLSNRLTAIEANTSNTSKQVEQLQKFFA
jgi:hypothetical protein